MKTLNQIVLPSLAALTLLAIPAAPAAAAHGQGFGHGPGRGPGGAFGSGFMAELVAEKLDLTEAQRAEIRAIHESYHDEVEGLAETVSVARRALQDQIHAETFDETAIREAAARLGALEADLAVLRARIAADVHGVLTPEQLAEAQAMRVRMRERAEEWRDRGPRRFGRPGFDGPRDNGE